MPRPDINEITKIIVRIAENHDNQMPPDHVVRTAILARFPGATEPMIRAGYTATAAHFLASADRDFAEASRLNAEVKAHQEVLDALCEIALETGLELLPDTRMADFLQQAADAGNERARRLLGAFPSN